MQRKHSDGMRGVYLTAAELSKNSNLVVTVTARNGAGADILAYHRQTGRTFAVQVKTNTVGSMNVLRSFWLVGKALSGQKSRRDFVWVLVADHSVNHAKPPEFWIVPDRLALASITPNERCPAIPRSKIEATADDWTLFEKS